jgi:MFS family permease
MELTVGSEADRSESERRWSDAQSVVDGVATEGARRRLHRQKVIRLWILVAGAIVPLAVLALVLGLTDHHWGPRDTSEVPTWRAVVAISLIGVGLALETVGIVRTVRARRLGSAWRSATAVLTGKERKRLLKQVRGQQVTDPDRLPLARDLADSLVAQRHFLFVWLGVALTAVAQPILSSPHSDHLVTNLVAGFNVALFAVGTPLVIREVRRAQRFLRQNPLPEAAERPPVP